MEIQPVVAVFDIGKTNKKVFLFDQHYRIVFEHSVKLDETTDEDGDACENLDALKSFIYDSLKLVLGLEQFLIRAINFSTYGASFVLIDEEGSCLGPMYNYLKPYPAGMQESLYEKYGGLKKVSLETASPVLGSLNSGLQLYRISKEQPALFEKINYALHLPQYVSALLSGQYYSDITSIGCHTALWNFQTNSYHQWVSIEGIAPKLAPVVASTKAFEGEVLGRKLWIGSGLHDSSAALIPYLVNFKEPFVLISTGTWCISLNPFNDQPLTEEELQQDCLCYLTYQGKPVKASRLFSGYEHEQQLKRITEHYGTDAERYHTMEFDEEALLEILRAEPRAERLESFSSDTAAYHYFIYTLVQKQVASTDLVTKGSDVKRIFVDGGFSRNNIFMNLMSICFPGKEIYAASMAQATAVGAALAIHDHWNEKPFPHDIIELKYFSTSLDTLI